MILLLFIFKISFSEYQLKEKSYKKIVVGLNIPQFNILDIKSYPKEIFFLIFETFVRLDPVKFKIEPQLARSWRILKDGKEWIFYLRKDLRWGDGTPLTTNNLFFLNNNSKIKLEKIDDFTVKIIFPNSFYPIYNPLPPIIPKSLFEKESEKKVIFGTGPFILEKYSPNNEIVFKRNPYYWRKDLKGNKLPYLDELVIKLGFSIEENLDIVELTSKDFSKIKNLVERYRIYNIGPNLESDVLLINQNPNSNIPKYKLRWFQNVKFRKAIACAINKDLINKEVYLGYAHKILSPINPLSPYYTPNTFNYYYDLEKSKKLLEEIGFKDRDKDGTLEDIWGNALDINLFVNNNEESYRIAEILKEDLKKIGIKLNIIHKDSIFLKLFQDFNWEFILFKHKWNFNPIDDSIIYLSKGAQHFWFPFQRKPFYSWEEEIDYLFNRLYEAKSIIEKKLIFYNIQRIWSKNLPLIIILNPPLIYLVKNNIENFKPSLYYGPLWNSYEISVK